MREDEVNDIVRAMSSFYKEYFPENSSYEKLIEIFIDSIETIWSEVVYYRNAVNVETSDTLKKIRYQKIDIKRAIYSKNIALKIKDLPLESFIDYCNQNGYYIEFTFSDSNARTPIVYDLTLKVDFYDERPLDMYTDYFLRDNRLYLMASYISELEVVRDHYHAFDIFVNDFLLESKWGHLFEVETGNFLPRYRYRDVLSAFRRVLNSNLTIRDIKEAIKLATKWPEFDLQDIKSPNLTPARKRLYDEFKLSPAKFIVILGEELIGDKIHLNVLIALLDEAKETQTNYLIQFVIKREDWLPYGDECKPTYLYRPVDDPKASDEVRRNIQKIKSLDWLELPHRYDMGRYYDNLLHYDFDEEGVEDYTMDSQHAVMDVNGAVMDTPWLYKMDWFKLTVYSDPRIPRNVAYNLNGNNLVVTFDRNNDKTKFYELYGSTDNENFSLLEQTPNSENTKISINHDATSSGIRYYKLRAVAGSEKSLFTLPYDINS